MNYKMNLYLVIVLLRSKFTFGLNRFLKLVDDFMIIDINLRKYLYIFINYLLEKESVLRV